MRRATVDEIRKNIRDEAQQDLQEDPEAYAWAKEKEDTEWYPGADCPLLQTLEEYQADDGQWYVHYAEDFLDHCPFRNQDGTLVDADSILICDVLMFGTAEDKEELFRLFPKFRAQYSDNKVYDEDQEKLLEQLLADDQRYERKQNGRRKRSHTPGAG